MLDKLEIGVSTREDVLLLLGEPDNDGANDSWMAYGSVYGEGGILFLICAGSGCGGGGGGGEKMDYRRLIVTFNELGVMTNAEFLNQECWEGLIGLGSSGGRSAPCLHVYDPPENDENITFPVANGGTAYQNDITFIPKDLSDFANGKAELITPGWTTGIAAAWAAGEHTHITKELHDKGQWEALARVVLNDNYGDNLRWYYLGRAAEGMHLCDTALHYYGMSEKTFGKNFDSLLRGWLRWH